MSLIEPALADGALLRDIAAADGGDGFCLWWLGQSGFLVKWQGKYLLFDPYLSEPLTKKYADTDKPHVRLTRRALDPALLAVDVITSTHNHTDHLDGETILPLRRANPALELVLPEANRAFAVERLGCRADWPVGLDAGARAEVAGFDFTGVAAAHETVERDERGRCKFMGYVVRFGPWTVYHSGDTMLYEGMAEHLSSFGVDVALLPINGRAPERRVAGNLSGEEAAQLARDIGARLVVPCHYDMFAFNTASPAAFEARCAQLGQAFVTLQCGRRWSSEELQQ